MNSHVLSEIEMLANRVAIVDRGKVVVQDDLQNLLSTEREIYGITFEANGDLPDYISSVERTGNLVKASLPRERLYDFMDYTRNAGLNVHECSLRKRSLEESFFRIIQAEGPAA
jgi:ABC-type multidrug transport system ATPase subunit